MITIAQAGGAGAGSPSLDHAWLDVPIQITGSASVTVLDKTDGMTVTVGGVASAHTVTLSGGPGAVRLGLVDAGVSVVRVIGATKDVDGNVLDVASPPCYQERPGERNGTRSYAHAWDVWAEELRTLRRGGSIVRHTSGAATLVPNAVNIVDGATSLVCPESDTWQGAIVVKLKNSAGGITIARSGADTLNGSTTYTIDLAYGECVIQQDTVGRSELLVSPGLT